MLLLELYNPPIAGLQDVDQDRSQLRWREFRKSKISLGDLNRINEMLSVRAYEHAQDLKLIQDQYGPKAAPPMMQR